MSNIGFPDLTRMINDIQRSDIRNKDICETAVIEYYKILGKAEALKDATGRTVLSEKKEKIKFVPAKPPRIENVKESKKKHISLYNKNELYQLISELGYDLIDDINLEEITKKELLSIIDELKTGRKE